MLELTNSQFKKEIADFKGLAIVDFWAPWCGPCQMLGPVIEILAHENKNQTIKFAKVNVDNENELAMQFSVQSIPTVKFFKNGKIVDEFVGVLPKEKIKALIEKNK